MNFSTDYGAAVRKLDALERRTGRRVCAAASLLAAALFVASYFLHG